MRATSTDHGAARTADAVSLAASVATRASSADDETPASSRGVLDAAPNEVYVLALDDGRILHANRRAQTNLGFGLAELKARTLADVTADLDAATVVARLAPLGRGAERAVFTCTFKRKNGAVYPVLFNLERTRHGGVPAVLGVAIDETTRVATERRLEESEDRYRRLADHALDVVFRFALATSTFEYLSPSAETALGVPVEYALADAAAVLARFDEAGRRFFADARERAGTQDPFAHLDAVYTHPAGQRLWLHVRAAIALDEQGRPAALEGSISDVTARREAEDEVRALNAELEERVEQRTRELALANRELTEANAELEAFGHSVGHDLRAPLRSIDGFTRILLEVAGDALPPEGHHAAERVIAAVRRMDKLIEDLLRLARFGRRALHREPCDLVAIARRVAGELATASRGHVELVTPSQIDVDADAQSMEVLLRNLLENAWKFTRNSTAPRVELGETHITGERTFFVRDNGIGFDMGHALRVFGVFERLHGTEAYEGTGVGLALVERAVARHGGRTWAVSKEGEGATFYFTLPSKAAARRPASGPTKSTAASSASRWDDQAAPARSAPSSRAAAAPTSSKP